MFFCDFILGGSFMARKKLNCSEEKIQAMIRAGRGQGEGADYIPWLQIGDFSSQGRSHRIQDHKNGRIHHLFSDLESDYYHILAWTDSVVDIREQYPLLPRSETERIADELGIRHPRNPGGKINEVMTTDFLVTVRDQMGNTHYEARYVKYECDLKKPRVCEKLQIEEQFWTEKEIPFKVVTEQSFHRLKARNIQTLLGYYPSDTIQEIGEQVEDVINTLMDRLTSQPYLPLREHTNWMDIFYGFPAGTSLRLFFHLAAHKLIPLHLEEKLLATQPTERVVDIELLKMMLTEEVEHHVDLDERCL
jgi:hypothetical protein